jgi:hypothetical protein
LIALAGGGRELLAEATVRWLGVAVCMHREQSSGERALEQLSKWAATCFSRAARVCANSRPVRKQAH